MAAEKFHTGICDEELINERVYLSTHSIGRTYNSFRIDEKLSVFFVNEDKDICRQIVDKWGNIRNFPGIIYCETFVNEFGKHKVEPVVRFHTCFARCVDGKYLMVWTVRPDGDYWMDSWGFGAEEYESVCLYSLIDQEGNFTQPFKLHSIGNQYYGEYKL